MSRTQTRLLRANMGFSPFKSRTEMTLKVQVLRGFVLQHSEHALRKVCNGLTMSQAFTLHHAVYIKPTLH